MQTSKGIVAGRADEESDRLRSEGEMISFAVK